MKKLLSLLVLTVTLFSFTNTFAQKQKAFVRFAETPQKKLIKDEISTTDFFVEFKSKKEATIYLELKKGDRPYGNAVKTIKSKKLKKIKLNIKTWAKVIPGSGYSYNLYMFEGPAQTWSKKLGETTIIEDIKISRLY